MELLIVKGYWLIVIAQILDHTSEIIDMVLLMMGCRIAVKSPVKICVWDLCRTCNGKPELQLTGVTTADSPKYNLRIWKFGDLKMKYTHIQNLKRFILFIKVENTSFKLSALGIKLYPLPCNRMTTIGLISDTHGYMDDNILQQLSVCDEIWHGGDFGNIAVIEQLQKIKPVRGVYGNIDGQEIRALYPEQLVFTCEQVKVMMRHIGGYPPKYNAATKPEIKLHQPKLFISGHSHILKVMYDDALQCLHMNPGAAGKQGWHKVRTIIKFVIDGEAIKDCVVIELGGR